jgi:Kef-type K+ transport system membrane component KefB
MPATAEIETDIRIDGPSFAGRFQMNGLPSGREYGQYAGLSLPGQVNMLSVQIAITLAAALLVSRAARALGQPAVIGEMIAGIALGPTLLGALAPGAYQSLFPAASLAALRVIADLGVTFFMFTVGLRINAEELRRNRRSAVIISHVSIALPLILGIALARPLYAEFAPAGTPFAAFALFLGVAMSITAFPVLARLLSQHELMETPVASITLTSAAAGDLTAWFLLALVTAIARAEALAGAILTFGAAVMFTMTMLLIVKPLLHRMRIGNTFALLVLFVSAAVTHMLGYHAIFGAFLAGCIIPRQSTPGQTLAGSLDSVNAILVPVFFAYVGLQTDMSMLLDPRLAMVAIAVIVIATIGKLGGSSLAAWWTGSTPYDALVVGTLMNTRGLVELIAVDIAYQLGVISRSMFTIIVLMALATTIATSPLLRLWKRFDVRIPVAAEVPPNQ